MKLIARILATLLILSLGVPSRAATRRQDAADPAKPPTKAEDKKAAKPAASLTLHIKVAFEDNKPLPTNSRLELSSENESCIQGVLNTTIGSESGAASFLVPHACKVNLAFRITGIPAQSLTVDLKTYRDPLYVLVRNNKRIVIQPQNTEGSANNN